MDSPATTVGVTQLPQSSVPPQPSDTLPHWIPQVWGTQLQALLSTTPLQSSSSPLQVSVVGLWLRLQAAAPLTHEVVPGAQMPSWPVLHAIPPPGLPLSTTPLQSSSSPLHVSVVGFWLRLQTIAPELQ